MALEAAEQTIVSQVLTDAQSQGLGEDTIRYLIREINIGRALVIPESAEGVEVKLALRSYNVSLSVPSETWHEFIVYSFTDRAQWIEHCRGLISAEQQPTAEEVENDQFHVQAGQATQEKIDSADEACSKSIIPSDLYKSLKGLGLEYDGPFTSVKKILINANRASGEICIPDTAANMPSNFKHPYILHLATLDACLHMVFAPLWELSGSLKPMVPTHIAEISVLRDFSNKAEDRLRVYSHVVKDRTQNVMADLLICKKSIESSKPSPLVEISGISLTPLSDGGDKPKDSPSERNMASSMQWKLQSSSLGPKSFKEVCSVGLPEDSQSAKMAHTKEACLHFVAHALKSLFTADIEALKPFHRRYYDWMCEAVSARKDDFLPDMDALIEAIKAFGADEEMMTRIDMNMILILKGEVDPLGVMMEDNLLNELYKSDKMDRLYCMLRNYVFLLGFQKPEMNVLEIGAGTDGATVPTLKDLTNPDFELGYAHNVGRYMFTDISSGFFVKAENLLHPWK